MTPTINLAALALTLALSPPKVSDDWPPTVPRPTGLRFYEKTRLNQNLSITNGIDSLLFYRLNQDDVFTNSAARINPNRIFPWAVSGGLHDSSGWTSKTAVSFPPGKSVIYWSERIYAGARHNLPKYSWSYPVGTVFADLLFNGPTLFEVRLLERDAKGWKGSVPYRNDLGPKEYAGPGKACAACHDHAGAWLEYGSLIRGGDGIFSFPVLEVFQGNKLDSSGWPIKAWTSASP